MPSWRTWAKSSKPCASRTGPYQTFSEAPFCSTQGIVCVSEVGMQSSEDLGNTFSRAWQLLTANWIMIVPGIVIAIIAGVLIAVLAMVGFGAAAGFGTMGMAGAGIGAGLLGAAIIALVLILATILTIAYTTGMAGAAWRTGRATLDDGAAAFRTGGEPCTL